MTYGTGSVETPDQPRLPNNEWWARLKKAKSKAQYAALDKAAAAHGLSPDGLFRQQLAMLMGVGAKNDAQRAAREHLDRARGVIRGRGR